MRHSVAAGHGGSVVEFAWGPLRASLGLVRAYLVPVCLGLVWGLSGPRQGSVCVLSAAYLGPASGPSGAFNGYVLPDMTKPSSGQLTCRPEGVQCLQCLSAPPALPGPIWLWTVVWLAPLGWGSRWQAVGREICKGAIGAGRWHVARAAWWVKTA